jgi:putative flippase GtrA
MPTMASTGQRFRELIPELAKFGVVGFIASVADLGGAAYLHGAVGLGPLVAKAISLTVGSVITYLGCRFWTFRHRVSQALLRETSIFIALNLVGLVIAEGVIALTTYGFGLKGVLAYNGASLAGTGLGTVFRYLSYKKWVFLPDVPAPSVSAPAHLAPAPLAPAHLAPAPLTPGPLAPPPLGLPAVYAGPRTG